MSDPATIPHAITERLFKIRRDGPVITLNFDRKADAVTAEHWLNGEPSIIDGPCGPEFVALVKWP